MIDVLVPDLGTGPDELITVSCLLVEPGDEVVEGDRLVELLIGEITFDVASPTSGKLQSIVAEVDETVVVGSILGTIVPDGPSSN